MNEPSRQTTTRSGRSCIEPPPGRRPIMMAIEEDTGASEDTDRRRVTLGRSQLTLSNALFVYLQKIDVLRVRVSAYIVFI
jgi:hypothetical protein